MNSAPPVFREPTSIEKIFNRTFGFLIGMGLGSSCRRLLQVRGRKSGKLFSTPVNILDWNGRQYLVAPRGRTQWVRNAEASGEVTLKKGSSTPVYRLAPVADAAKPPILKAYLESFKPEVQRYFPVAAGSPAEAFAELTGTYPVFELIPR